MNKKQILKEIEQLQYKLKNGPCVFPTGYLQTAKELVKLYRELNKLENIWTEYIVEYERRVKELEKTCKSMGV